MARRIEIQSNDEEWIGYARSLLEAARIHVSIEPGAEPANAVLLDARDVSLDTVCRRLIENHSDVPKLIVAKTPQRGGTTLRRDAQDMREALIAAGADDVMYDAGIAQQFMARVRSLLVRHMPPRMLLIEDELQDANWVMACFRDEPFDLEWARSLREARAIFSRDSVDVMIVDRMLEDGDGIEFVEDLRSRQILAPALVLSNLQEDAEVAFSIDSGADGHITKPVSCSVLKARVKAALRSDVMSQTLHFGMLDISLRDKVARWRGDPIPLSALVFAFLAYLAERHGLEIPKLMILEDVWATAVFPSDITDFGPTQKKSEEPVVKIKQRLTKQLRRAGVPDCIISGNGTYLFDPAPLLDLR